MPDTGHETHRLLDPAKFRDPDVTARGETRAHVPLRALKTLWFNTGSLCNIACRNCYIESSPGNDRLAYLSAAEVCEYLDEIESLDLPVEEIGFTGGEPFLNKDGIAMLEAALVRGFRVLVLTNAMKPMQLKREALLRLKERFGPALVLRVSIDHYEAARHEDVRGEGTWAPMMAGLEWLARSGFTISVAGRKLWGETEASLRAGFARLFAATGIGVDADDPGALVLFPEMDPHADVPEITTGCWDILGLTPEAVMCSSSRMVIKRRGAAQPAVVSCTLLPYDPQFELAHRLADALGVVKLNHAFCAQFCVLGGASCSAQR